ncbi:hypothetical protein MHU86_11678 [Fragilaria crotonensis]|nr:hypothetical protein MHU86_11678 [Fragilaria crotonensis]
MATPNSGPVDGWHRCQSSLRSEAAAIASLTLYVNEFATYHQVDIQCNFRLYVDSTSAISNVKLLRDLIPIRRFPNHADLLSTMSSAHYVLKHFRLTHVPNHQDDSTAFDDLPFPAQLNVLCDTMATDQLKQQSGNAAQRTLSIPLIPRTLSVAVRYSGQVISSHYIARLRESICLARHRAFLQAKYKWTNQIWESIAWDSFMQGARRPALVNPVTRSKLVHNWLNLGSQRAKFGSGGSNLEIARQCPYCAEAEDFLHMLTCVEPRALAFRYYAMIPLRKVLADYGERGSTLLRAIRDWTLNPASFAVSSSLLAPTEADRPSAPFYADRALYRQHAIGWLNFSRGFVSLEWGSAAASSPVQVSTNRLIVENAPNPHCLM